MTRFSANLGFLWTELPLPDAIRAAATAGFDAVECHWPYDIAVADVRAALSDTGLPMLGVNTVRGRPGTSDFGTAAVPGRETEAREAIHQAVDYAAAVGARNVHVMAGIAEGPTAEACFLSNLQHACDLASPHGIGILIEPINPFDAPGYFLSGTGQAAHLMARVARDNLRMMFDFYHVERAEGDALTRVEELLPQIGHIQFAAVPDRGPPDHGSLDYRAVFSRLDTLGWDQPLGAEYKPGRPTAETLGWMTRLV